MRDGTRGQGVGGAHTVFVSVVDDHELRSIAGSGGDGGTFVPRDEDAAIAADLTCDIDSTTHERFAVHRFEQLAASETLRTAGCKHGGEYDRLSRCQRWFPCGPFRCCSHAL